AAGGGHFQFRPGGNGGGRGRATGTASYTQSGGGPARATDGTAARSHTATPDRPSGGTIGDQRPDPRGRPGTPAGDGGQVAAHQHPRAAEAGLGYRSQCG